MSPFDIEWYRIENLAAEWQRKDARRVAMKTLTIVALVVVAFVPTLWSLMDVIAAVGVDGLLMMLEINVAIGLMLLAAPALKFLWVPLRSWFARKRQMMTRREALAMFLQRDRAE